MRLSETFKIKGESITRQVVAGDADGTCSIDVAGLQNLLRDECAGSERLLWELLELRGFQSRQSVPATRRLRIVDLYSGCGGLALGARRAVEAVGLIPEFVAAIDLDDIAISVHAKNLNTRLPLHESVDHIIDYQIDGHGRSARFAYVPEITDAKLMDGLGRPDLLIAGPPCQGHSNLNNLSRRADPRNRLYLTVPAIAVALDIPIIVIENVPEILKDQTDVIATAKGLFGGAGYKLADVVLKGELLGVAQLRKRHFLVATRKNIPPLKESVSNFETPAPSVKWAIGDLEETLSTDFYDRPADLSPENQRRVDFLFNHGAYNLPNAERPDCHKNGHTYPSVYGRMNMDKPAQTITTGFLTPGRGRFIHPSQRRTITPHEAARLQGFPDYFRFNGAATNPLLRRNYSKLIGDAVPPPLGYYAVLCALAGQH